MTNKGRYFLQEGFVQLFITPPTSGCGYYIKLAAVGVPLEEAQRELNAEGGISSYDAERWGKRYLTEDQFNVQYREWMTEITSNFMNLTEAMKA